MPFRSRFSRRRSTFRRTRRVGAFRRRRPIRRTRFSRRKRAANLNRTSIRTFKGLGYFTPNQLKCKLRYSGIATATTTIVCSVLSLSGNGVYNPGFALTGHQPRGFDQLAQLYSRYYCGASKIAVRCIVSSPNANGIFAVEAVPQTTPPLAANSMNFVIERKYVSYRFAEQGNPLRPIKRYGTTAGVFGLTKNVVRSDMNEEYSGLTGNFGTGSSPSAQWSWQIYAQNADLNTETDFTIWYEIDYYITFFDRITPSAS